MVGNCNNYTIRSVFSCSGSRSGRNSRSVCSFGSRSFQVLCVSCLYTNTFFVTKMFVQEGEFCKLIFLLGALVISATWAFFVAKSFRWISLALQPAYLSNSHSNVVRFVALHGELVMQSWSNVCVYRAFPCRRSYGAELRSLQFVLAVQHFVT